MRWLYRVLLITGMTLLLVACGVLDSSPMDTDSEKSAGFGGAFPSADPNGSGWRDRPPTSAAPDFEHADVWVALYDVDRGGDQVGMEVWIMTEIDIQPYSLAVWVDGMQFSNNVPAYKGQGSQKIGGVKGRSHALVGSVLAGTDTWGRQKQCIKHSNSDADRSIFGCR